MGVKVQHKQERQRRGNWSGITIKKNRTLEKEYMYCVVSIEL